MKTQIEIESAIGLLELGLYEETQLKLDLVESLVFTPTVVDQLKSNGITDWSLVHDKTSQSWSDLTNTMKSVYPRIGVRMVTVNIDPIGHIETVQPVEASDRETWTHAGPIEPEDDTPKFFITVTLNATLFGNDIQYKKTLIAKIRQDWTISPETILELQEVVTR